MRNNLKLTVLVISLLLALASVALIFNNDFGLCGENSIVCFWQLRTLGAQLFIFVPVFIFSLITLPVNRAPHKLWAAFSAAWAGLTVFVTWMGTSEAGGSFGGLHDGYEAMVMLGLLVLYPIISIVLLVWKTLQIRQKGRMG